MIFMVILRAGGFIDTVQRVLSLNKYSTPAHTLRSLKLGARLYMVSCWELKIQLAIAEKYIQYWKSFFVHVGRLHFYAVPFSVH